MRTEQDFLTALKNCPPPDLHCRLEHVRQFGIAGIRASARGFSSEPPQKNPAPSYATIERAMKIVHAIAGYFLGPPYKAVSRSLNLAYKGHFKILKDVNKSIERYWDSIAFVRWVGETLLGLPEPLRTYISETGNFDFRKYGAYFVQVPNEVFQSRLEELNNAAAILEDFDRVLLEDLEELFTVMYEGLLQIQKLSPASTTIDLIAIATLNRDVQLTYLSTQNDLRHTIKMLISHHDSWQSVSNQKNSVTRDPGTKVSTLVRTMQDAVVYLSNIAHGGK
ncbi:MAG: hypothetical protein R3B54_02855 [Bdellovibrionota bacterium]